MKRRPGVPPAPASPPAAAARPARRSLLPREHGAWGQLLFPLAVALALGRPRLASDALALAALFAFVAHEPLQVLLGARGPRVRTEEGTRARRWLAALAVGAVLLGLSGVARAPREARLSLAVPLGLGVLAAFLALTHRERTVGGQLAVGAALASPGVPVAVAGGASFTAALAAWVSFTLAFGLAELAARAVSARGRAGRAAFPLRALAALAVPVVALLVAPRLALPWPWAASLVAPALVAAWACLAPVTARRLPTVGWSLLAASLTTAALLISGLRGLG